MRAQREKISQEKKEEVMLDPKHLVAHVINETVKWVAIGLGIALSVGIAVGVLLSLCFR